MSGERGRHGGWLLPAIVVLAGAVIFMIAAKRGTLRPVSLRPAQWAGIVVMLTGAVAAITVRKRPLVRLAGVLACGVGAILVIAL